MILRPFNTYGPRQSARAVIPTVLAQLLAGARRAPPRRLTPQRDFTFVTDTARRLRPRRRRRPRARRPPCSSAPGARSRSARSSTCADGHRLERRGRHRRRAGSARRLRGRVLLSDPTLARRAARLDAAGRPRGRPAAHGRLAAAAESTRLGAHGTTDDRAHGETHAPGARGPPAPSRWPRRTSASSSAIACWTPSTPASSPRSGPFVARFEEEFAAPSGPGTRSRAPAGPPPCTSRCAWPASARRRGARLRLHLHRLGQPGRLPGRRRPCSSTPRRDHGTWTPTSLADELDRRAAGRRAEPAGVEVVHVLGQPADLDAASLEIVRRATASRSSRTPPSRLGCRAGSTADWHGRQHGTVGAVGAFSFNGNKIVTDRRRRHDRHRRRRPRRAAPGT